MNLKKLLSISALFFCTWTVHAQQVYFVDGYHGGVYGHYPMWVTKFTVDHLIKHPEWRIGMEIEPETWDTVQVKDPEGYQLMQTWVNSNRVDFTNPTYAQPYLYNISGESIIRQFTYGFKKHRAHFPSITFSTYAVEEPCFTSCLPQLLNQFGFKYAVLKCPNTLWGGYTRAYGGELLNWIAPDGSSILTVPRYTSEAFEENSTWQTTAWNNSDRFIEQSRSQGIQNPIGMTYQDAGWDNGPWLGTGNRIKNNSIYTTWTEYFEKYAPKKSDDHWKLTQEDIQVNLMWGSQVLQQIAQQVRSAENALLRAEKIAAMSTLEKGFKIDQDSLSEAWRTLMMAQHHDSWIVPYNKLNPNQTWAQAIKDWTSYSTIKAEEFIQQALGAPVTSNVESNKNTAYVRVYNTLGHLRTEIVSVHLPSHWVGAEVIDEDGRSVPNEITASGSSSRLAFQAAVSAVGYSTYEIREVKKESKAKQHVTFDQEGNCLIDHDLYRIVLDKSRGGTIKSLKVKQLKNKEFANQSSAYSMNEISGHFYKENSFKSTKDSPATFKVLHDHSLSVQVAIYTEIAGHPVIQTITLNKGQKRIDFDLLIDWKGEVGIGEYAQKHKWTDNRRAYTDDRYKLKILFPTSIKQQEVYKNAPFDVLKSNLDSTYFGRWDDIKHNVILNWVDAYDPQSKLGLAVLTDHTSSYVHGPDLPLGLTIQYSGVGLWGMDYKITEALKMKYALIPHTKVWDESAISEESNTYNEPLYAFYADNLKLENKEFLTMEHNGFEISSIQESEDQVIVRFFNASSKKDKQAIKLHFPVQSITEVRLDGKELGAVPIQEKNGQSIMSLTIPRFGLKTITIKR
ncbi:glycoside hydrolase family 38 C-terminal domain-containing protein [Sphingobacterium sp. HJSM2_6]